MLVPHSSSQAVQLHVDVAAIVEWRGHASAWLLLRQTAANQLPRESKSAGNPSFSPVVWKGGAQKGLRRNAGTGSSWDLVPIEDHSWNGSLLGKTTNKDRSLRRACLGSKVRKERLKADKENKETLARARRARRARQAQKEQARQNTSGYRSMSA